MSKCNNLILSGKVTVEVWYSLQTGMRQSPILSLLKEIDGLHQSQISVPVEMINLEALILKQAKLFSVT